jgi:hypothetical protein
MVILKQIQAVTLSLVIVTSAIAAQAPQRAPLQNPLSVAALRRPQPGWTGLCQ